MRLTTAVGFCSVAELTYLYYFCVASSCRRSTFVVLWLKLRRIAQLCSSEMRFYIYIILV